MDKRHGEIFFKDNIEISSTVIPHEVAFPPGDRRKLLKSPWVTYLKSAQGPPWCRLLWELCKRRCALDFIRIMGKVF